MARNRHKRKIAITPTPDFISPSIKYSPAVEAVMNRIVSGGEDYLRQNIIHILTDSVKLAEEPEFSDLDMGVKNASEVSQRWMQKFEKRMAAARKESPDEFQEVFDEMRIEVINELATPAFRKDVDKRLQVMLDRLTISEDLEKLEMVLLLKPLLGMKKIPWGVCGLILEILNRTMQQGKQEYEDENSVYDAVVKELIDEGEEQVDITNILKMPEKLEQIGQKLFAATPGLRERVEKQIWDMVDAFEKELAKGNITLDLFTQAELLSPFQHLEAEFGNQFFQSQPTEEIRQRTLDAIVHAINEMMTPERFQRLRKEVESKANAWMFERKKWGAALQGELLWLDKDQYEENKFLVSAFTGQIMRLGKEQKPAAKKKEHGRRR